MILGNGSGSQYELETIHPDTELCSKALQQQGDLASSSAFIHMRLIKNEQHSLLRIPFQPFRGILPDTVFRGSYKHVLQHGVVGHQDVRRMPLHFKTHQHLSIQWTPSVPTFRDHIGIGENILLFRETSRF